MERTKYILLVLFFNHVLFCYGQNNKAIYSAYLIGDMKKWRFTLDSMDDISKKTDRENLELINYYYGYIGWCIGNNEKSEAEKYIEKSEEIISQLEQKKYYLSIIYAYKSAYVGFQIGISPYKAPFIGAESVKFAKESVQIDPINPLGYIQLGNVAFYTPSMFGGSKTEAIKYYLKALQIMDSQSDNKYNWNYINLIVTIINAYIDLEQYKKANYYCKKVLSFEPDFKWVKDELHPHVLKQLKNE
ncbi:MAG: hypothetical protein JW717_07755 [Marinilabiliaceae bacterium]|nr:hypothetical protein [Marinilabiliaceae bacterium]